MSALPRQSRSMSLRMVDEEVQENMNEYRNASTHLTTTTPPPILFYHASLPESHRTPITNSSSDYGAAVDMVLRIMTHTGHSNDTRMAYSYRLSEIVKYDAKTRKIWRSSKLKTTSDFEGPSPQDIQDFIFARHPDVRPLAIIFTNLGAASEEAVWGRVDKETGDPILFVSIDLIKVFVQTKLGLPYAGPHSISVEKYEAVRICAQQLLISTIFHELGHVLTRHFFGATYVTPTIPSIPRDETQSYGEFGYAMELDILGAITVVEWKGTAAFRNAKTDEERLWIHDKMLCKVFGPGLMWRTTEVEQAQFQLLEESLSHVAVYHIHIPENRPNLALKNNIRARTTHRDSVMYVGQTRDAGGALHEGNTGDAPESHPREKPSSNSGNHLLGLGIDADFIDTDFIIPSKCHVYFTDEDGKRRCKRG